MELAKELKVIVMRKGEVDVISDGDSAYFVNVWGSLKWCGGQGDLLSGILGTYAYWAK